MNVASPEASYRRFWLRVAFAFAVGAVVVLAVYPFYWVWAVR